jgi:hypothetical protein
MLFIAISFYNIISILDSHYVTLTDSVIARERKTQPCKVFETYKECRRTQDLLPLCWVSNIQQTL